MEKAVAVGSGDCSAETIKYFKFLHIRSEVWNSFSHLFPAKKLASMNERLQSMEARPAPAD